MEENLHEKLEKIRRELEKYDDLGYDKNYEIEWKRLFNELNSIKIEVYKNKIFSDNEEFSEVKTEDIKFMLISYFQSEFIQKFPQPRKQVLNFGITFYKEFFKLLKSYNYLSKEQIEKFNKLVEKNENEENNNNKKNFIDLSNDRNEKIAMYKYKKELSEKLKKIEKEKDTHYDESREYWESYLNLCIVKMFENLKMINMEIDSLNYLEKMKKEGKNFEEEKPNKNNLKMEKIEIKSPEDLFKLDPNNNLVKNLNFISSFDNNNFQFFNLGNIQTLDQKILDQLPENIKQKVFNNANPTTMTMDEFAEMQQKRMKEEEEKHKEFEKNKSDDDSDKEEIDDKKKKKAREWDDWKDENPKGSGNRMGK